MNKNVWIFQTGEPLHLDKDNLRPMRAINLSNYFIKKQYNVTLWSSAFYHQKKIHRTNSFKNVHINDFLNINLIPSMGYKNNISFKRILDHIILAKNLKKILSEYTNIYPDLIIIGFPPIETAYVFLRWAEKNNIKTVIDVKDQWPDIFINPFPGILKIFIRLMLFPYFKMTNYVFKKSNYISTISKSFKFWIMNTKKIKNSKKIFISSLVSKPISISSRQYDLEYRWWIENGYFRKNKKVLCFVGSLSRAFDFYPIYILAKYFNQEKINIDILICGSGEKNHEVKKLMQSLENVFFPGWIDINKINVLFKNSYAMLAPYKNSKDFLDSIPNKVIDAISNGLPVITSLRGEVKKLIVENNIGVNYTNEKDICLKVTNFLNNINKNKINKNLKKLFFEKFDYEKNLEMFDKI